MVKRIRLAAAVATLALGLGAVAAGQKAYRLPGIPGRQLGGLIWGAESRQPADRGLAFGGEDPAADDGRPHTRILQQGAWIAIDRDLRAANPLQTFAGQTAAVRAAAKDALAAARRLCFEGFPAGDETDRVQRDLRPRDEKALQDLETLIASLAKAEMTGPYEQGQAAFAVGHLKSAADLLRAAAGSATPEALKGRQQATIHLGLAAEALDAEPPPRALSPIVYDAKTGLYVLFGGDHLDYLTNDTWVFDPAKRRWAQRHPAGAPAPRAGHTLTAPGNGTVTLDGGYTYTSNTDYCGPQYADVGGGPWTYDVAKDAWAGADAALPPDTRTYRKGPYHPDFFYQGAKPDRVKGEQRLKDLRANTWVALDPPRRPRLDRVWGTAVLDPDRDLILVWCGGHSSHGGSDVLHYHPATNRWELPYPVEFPLGQLYSNTSYPDSFNFNRRPWPTGHTYRDYGYDAVLKKMVFAGHSRHYYVYDPGIADWVGRAVKPKQMVYPGCFYDLTLCTTPRGLMAWGGYYGRAAYSKISRFDAATGAWTELALTGDRLPGSVCDRSCLVYDSKRDRLLAIVRQKEGCDLVQVDLKTLAVRRLSPAGTASAARIAFLREFCYDPVHDLVVGTTLPPDETGLRRTPAYDCAGNRWVSLKIGGPNPSGKTGRNVSLGLIYDPKRNLIWGMDNYHLQPFALRLDPATADMQPLP